MCCTVRTEVTLTVVEEIAILSNDAVLSPDLTIHNGYLSIQVVVVEPHFFNKISLTSWK